jgi:hypothetical protein
MRPFGEWDLVLLGVGAHRWLLLGSALPALALAALGFGNRRFRPFIGGFALGAAAFLAQGAWSGDVATIVGAIFGRVGASVCGVANALVCLWLAQVALQTAATPAAPKQGR